MKQEKRRHFFGFLGGLTAAAAASTLVKDESPVESVAEADSQTESEKKRGYQLTAHVRRYYETTLS